MKAFVLKMFSTPEYLEKYRFLGESIPYLQKVSKITRDRVTKTFKVAKFPHGHTLFKEGDFLKCAFIIKSGEVELSSNKNFKFI